MQNPGFRKLSSTDSGGLRAHLLRLDSPSRELRFGGFVSDKALDDYVDRVIWQRDFLYGFFAEEGLRGAIHLARQPSGSRLRRAELAISVERGWQGNGIGTELVRRSLRHARNHWLDEVFLICVPQNRAMQRVSHKLDGHLKWADGEVEATFALPWPDLQSMVEEMLEDSESILLSSGRLVGPASPVSPSTASAGPGSRDQVA